jgi:hypothetical protein
MNMTLRGAHSLKQTELFSKPLHEPKAQVGLGNQEMGRKSVTFHHSEWPEVSF